MEGCGQSEATLFDVIVVGGGIMGSCSAYYAAKRGCRILLLEQFDFLHHRGSSHGESRTIRATYPEHYYTPMALESFRLWEQAQSQIGYRVLYSTTQLDIGRHDDLALQSVIQSCRSYGFRFRVLNHHALAKEFSGRVAIPEDWIALVSEPAGVIKPTKAVSMFHSLALQNGAVLKDNTQVTNIERTDGEEGAILVRTSKGQNFYCRKCVVTAGAWTGKLVERVTGRTIPIQPLTTTISYWRIEQGYERDYSIEGSFPSFASYGCPYVYGTPALEYPGLIKVAVHGGKTCDPDNRVWGEAGGVGLEALREWVRERFGGRVDPNGPVVNQSCMYSMTPDEDFVIDFMEGELGKDVVVAGGFSGHGFKMGPVVGRVLVDMVLDGVAPGLDLHYFSFSRFHKNPKGNVKDFAEQVGLS